MSSAGRVPARVPGHVARGVADEADDDALRNLMAMDVEESIRAYPLDGVVLLTGCDKTNPASILGAASADIPTIVVTGGPMLNGLARARDRLLQRLALPRAARRAHHGAGLGRDRERHVPLERSLHDDGHRLDDGLRDGGARAHASRRCSDPGRRLAAPTPRGSGRDSDRRAGRGGRRALRHPHAEAFENAIRVHTRSPARPTRSST